MELPSLGTPIAVVGGRNDTIWVVDRNADSTTDVKQYSPKGEFLRRLAIEPSEPVPTKMAASIVSDAICLLEANDKCQRFRWLELAAPSAQPESTGSSSQPVSTWKEVLRRTITFSDQFAQAQPELKLPGGKPVVGQEKLRIQLVPNPLLQDKAGSQDVALGIDAEGSYLKTTDGLFLKRVTDTGALKWAVMDRDAGSKVVVVFQGDGAVVEEYRVAKPGNMMAFDYGDFQLPPPKP
jgi:hypothetical protein